MIAKKLPMPVAQKIAKKLPLPAAKNIACVRASSNAAKNEAENVRKSSRPKAVVKSYAEPTESDITTGSAESTGARSAGVTAEVYEATEKIPRKNEKGELVFADHPEFRPNMTPMEVLQAGSFGGTYYRSIYSSVTGIKYKGEEVIAEFPQEWFVGLNMRTRVLAQNYDTKVNSYGVECGGGLDMWEGNGWIADCDPYGWFQWYCRFYLGRRCSDDERQISRGNGVMGPRGRWRNNLTNRVLASAESRGSRPPYRDAHAVAALADREISPKVRQLLQHWGYRLTLQDLEAAAKRK